jgi:hypothetical protein
MIQRAEHVHLDTPETVRLASFEELTDRLLQSVPSDRLLDRWPVYPIGYIPEGKRATITNVVDVLSLQQERLKLETEKKFMTPAQLLLAFRFKKRLAGLHKEGAIPAGAIELFQAHYPHYYAQVLGPQISNSEGAYWDLAINRICLVFKKEDTYVPLEGSAMTDYRSFELYQDETGETRTETLHKFLSADELKTTDNPELLSRLRYLANLL